MMLRFPYHIAKFTFSIIIGGPVIIQRLITVFRVDTLGYHFALLSVIKGATRNLSEFIISTELTASSHNLVNGNSDLIFITPGAFLRSSLPSQHFPASNDIQMISLWLLMTIFIP